MHLKTNGARLWAELMKMARIGATSAGGVNRIAFSNADREARDLFCAQCRQAGCTVTIDRVGNIFARRPGSDSTAAPVMIGSHLDSQPTGGRFDGVFGVLAGLEVVRTLNDLNRTTRSPIEIVSWTNEEGYIFKPMFGSAAFTGLIPLDDALGMREDREGWTVSEGLERIGYAGDGPMLAGRDKVRCYFEAHIEQGPVLEATGNVIGVVSAAQAQRWYDIVLIGREAHAGPTPMKARKDALMGMARIALEVERIARSNEKGCGTVGYVQVHPNSRNTIPGRVTFSGDLRHPRDEVLSTMDREFRANAASIASAHGLEISIEERAYIPPLAFDHALVDVVWQAATAEGQPAIEMFTGAGHDACNIARFIPTVMIFVPCKDGISHNEAEDAKPAHIEAGCNVLCNSVIAIADSPDLRLAQRGNGPAGRP